METDLPDLPERPEALAEGKKPSHQRYLSSLKGPWGEIALRVNLAGGLGEPSLFPYLVRKEMIGGSKWSASWDWLDSFKGDLGVFVDMTHVTKGSYEFGLDLMLNSKANHSLHEAFVSPVYEWVPLSLR